MDLPGLKPLFHQGVTVVTSIGKDFIGTLTPIDGSTQAISLLPLDDATASFYNFAINGVASLSIDAISYAQKLPPNPQ